MILFPPAKINLGLRVLYKRPDGYHEIDSCMVPIALTDVLEVLPASKFSFIQTGLTIPGNPEDNLCVKAYSLLKEQYGIQPVSIHLRKIIPMGAGLGGGSADAAYVLRALNELYALSLPVDTLQKLAAQLGSDCPFFIQDVPQLASGRGEILTNFPLNLTGYFLQIINPGIHIGTREAYAGINFQEQVESVKQILELPMENWKDKLINDFETSAFSLYPELNQIKQRMYDEGAVYAAMTGSGSTMFGIYQHEPKSWETNDWMEKIVVME